AERGANRPCARHQRAHGGTGLARSSGMAQSRTESRRLRGGDLTRQAMAVVAEVGDLAPPAAEQAVRDRCGGSAGLLAECLSLLRHDRTPGALPLLPPPRGEGPPDAVARLVRSPPQRIGRYVLGELIGCGATGAVFCARSEEVPRDVALKLIPAPRAHCGPPVLRIESAALARLSHPAIAN